MYYGHEAPTRADINFVRNKKEEKKELLNDISTVWRLIGDTLGAKGLDQIDLENPSIGEKFGKVFDQWKGNAPGLKHPNFYPYTWQGFYRLLDDVGKTEFANKYFEFMNEAHR